MGVNHDEEGAPPNRTSEINMDPLPRSLRPNPGVHRSHGRRSSLVDTGHSSLLEAQGLGPVWAIRRSFWPTLSYGQCRGDFDEALVESRLFFLAPWEQ